MDQQSLRYLKSRAMKPETSPEPAFYTALSVRQPHAERIAKGTKVEEFRSWRTDFRGTLLIVSSRTHDPGGAKCSKGVTVCLVDVVKLKIYDDVFGWVLANPRRVKRVPVKGQLKLFKVPASLVQLV